jgi:hypothetical protein
MGSWINSDIDETVMYKELPAGPHEPKVTEEQISDIMKFLQELRDRLEAQEAAKLAAVKF